MPNQTETDRQIQDLADRRAKLDRPIERILFDNDPANGPIGIRIIAALTEPPNAR